MTNEVLSGEEVVEQLGNKADEQIEAARADLNEALEALDWYEASIAASGLLHLLRLRQNMWELQ